MAWGIFSSRGTGRIHKIEGAMDGVLNNSSTRIMRVRLVLGTPGDDRSEGDRFKHGQSALELELFHSIKHYKPILCNFTTGCILASHSPRPLPISLCSSNNVEYVLEAISLDTVDLCLWCSVEINSERTLTLNVPCYHIKKVDCRYHMTCLH